MAPPRASTALLTDQYELTMLDGALDDGTAHRPCVFEVFTRGLPAGRRYGVVAGIGRLARALEDFRFTDDQLQFLADRRIVAADALAHLAEYRFTGDAWAYPDGELHFANSPVLTVVGTFADVILETLVLSVLNHDSAVAAAASRMRNAAGGRGLVEMGSRRTAEGAAPAAALAAYIGGFDATSNLEAGHRFGVPTVGTAAHAWTLVHDDEVDAFATQLRAQGTDTTLLVDTFDVRSGIRNAVDAARRCGVSGPGAVRIDSGDLGEQTRLARVQLDQLGAHDTRITVTGDLDEHAIAELADTPVDAYGVGTKVALGSGFPTAGFVYKLVAVGRSDGSWESVAKHSSGKATVGGRKWAWRSTDSGGAITGEHIITDAHMDATPDLPTDLPADAVVQVPLFVRGERVHDAEVEESRSFHRDVLRRLPPEALAVDPGDPAVVPVHAAAEVRG